MTARKRKRPAPAQSPEPEALAHIARDLRVLARPIGELSADPANARRHPRRSIDAIAASLRRFGQRKPIVVDAAGVCVAGSGQLEAARELGWTHIAAAVCELEAADRAAYAIADNRTGELSEWDQDALRQLAGTLSPEDLEAAGFTPEELLEVLGAGSPETIVEDEPPVPAKRAVSRLGDLWLLGEHRLLCGDSTEVEDVHRVMAGEAAALCATDPPYLVDYTGVRAGGLGKDWSEHYREIEIKDGAGFFRAVFGGIVQVLAPGGAIYCWHAHKRVADIVQVWRELGILDHQQIIWVKPAAVFGSVFWHFRHEPCLMGWVQGSKPPHDGEHAGNSVWTAPMLSSMKLEDLTKEQLVVLVKDGSSAWELGWEGGKSRPPANGEHPTVKPVEIFARPIRKHTGRGDVCFEPFSGSGTQLVAAEQLGRRCYAIELEPVFVDVAVRRWQILTGKAATLEDGGKTWAAVAKSRKVRAGSM